MKRFYKKYRSILKKIITILVIILLLLLIFGYLQSINDKFTYLIQYITEQNIEIEKLKESNANLNEIANYNFNQIKEMNNVPIPEEINNTVQVQNEIPQEDKELSSMVETPNLLVTTGAVLFGVAKAITSLIPSF